MNDIIIIGGGVAGLTAALHLAERGLQPIILEADAEYIGGRLRDAGAVQLTHAGRNWSFPAEHGIHGIWSPYVNLRAMLERHNTMPTLLPSQEETWIFGRAKLVRRANIGSAIRGSAIPAPFHYLAMLLRPRFLNLLSLRDLLSLFLVEGSLLAALAIDPLAEGKAIAGMSLADFTHGWSPTIRSLFTGLARNALGAHAEEVPAAGFIAFLRFYTLLRRDAWRFGYLPGTGGALIAAPLAKSAVALGAELCLGCTVTELDTVGNAANQQWLVRFTNSVTGVTSERLANHIVLALDAPAAKRLLCASAATTEAATTLQFPTGVPTVILRFWFACKPRSIADSGICTGDFLVDNFFWLHQLQPAYREWSAATGGSAIELHIYGPQNICEQPDAALLAQVTLDIYRAFPELRGHALHATISRNAATHTLFSPGEPGGVLAVATPWPGIVACGDWIADANPALYLERAATTGVVAANMVLTALGRQVWPVHPHPKPEPLAGALSSILMRFRHALVRRRAKNKQTQ